MQSTLRALATGLVNVVIEAGICHIELNRPEVGNVVNLELAKELRGIAAQLVTSTEIRVVLLSGAGRNFMAGGDLMSLLHDPEGASQTVQCVSEAVKALFQCEMPVVCAVQGLVAGGGLALALSADILIAEDGARFTVGGPAVGLVPDAGVSWLLEHRVGSRRAMEMGLLCTTVSATEAVTFGIATEIAPEGALMDVAWKRARHLAAAAQMAMRETKKLLQSASSRSLEQQQALEFKAFGVCMQHADSREGIEAVLGKRKPKFQ